MTSSGDSFSGARGVDEPDWIDKVLKQATDQVDVPQPDSLPRLTISETPATPPRVAPVRRAASADSLAEIQWVDAPQVTPASTPIVSVPAKAPTTPASAAPPAQELVPAAVGRSAWDEDLAHLGDNDPDGWDKLSWQDLEDEKPAASSIREETGFGRLLREWGPVLFAAVAIALFTRLVLVQAYHIPSSSMVPTLQDGDRVVVNRLSYRFGEIERGQVVVFAKPQGTAGDSDLIKRVVGLPGEEIRLADDKVFINGLRVDEPYLREQDSTRPKLTIPGCDQADPARDRCTIPEGFVFVMGDNRRDSSDSRVFGPVPTDSIVGRAFVRVWPLNDVGQL